MTGGLRLLAAGLVLHLLLILPAAPLPAAAALLRIAPELPLILLALTCLGRGGRIAVTVGLCLLTLQKLADLAMQAALGRGFNPLADLALIGPALRLIVASAGIAGLALTLAAGLCLALILIGGLWWACGVWSRWRWRGRPAGWLGLIAAAACLPALSGAGAIWPGNVPYALARIQLAVSTAQDLRQLRQAARRDDLAGATGLLGAIDRDVLVIFVESYGRASFDAAFHAETHLATLRDGQDRLGRAGLAMRSGFLTAPTQGGQSWLSHATFASGLRIADQPRHGALLSSGRQGLFHHARRAGFRTAAVMPAITRPWPEAATMGFDRILAAADLGYRGRPFDWVTMPDQFTLAATDRLLRSGPPQPHLFAQIVLISSHAPWVPVARMIPWDRLGDGSVFDPMTQAGDPPQVVWRDRDRVRRAYREAVDYSLQTVIGYALLHAADPPLMIVLGDHQPAPWLAMAEGRDVPVHLIGPAPLVDRAASWGLSPGLIPDAATTAIPMEAMRDLILRGFGGDAPPE